MNTLERNELFKFLDNKIQLWLYNESNMIVKWLLLNMNDEQLVKIKEGLNDNNLPWRNV